VLVGPIADLPVLGQNDPTLGTGTGEPDFIKGVLWKHLVVDDDRLTSLPECLGNDLAAEASVYKKGELRLRRSCA